MDHVSRGILVLGEKASHIGSQGIPDAGHDHSLNLGHGRAAIDFEDIEVLLVRVRFLEGFQLRMHHCALHVMALSTHDSLHQDLLVRSQVDEVHGHLMVVVGGDADDIPIPSPQCRAGDDDAVVGLGGGRGAGREAGHRCLAKGDEPVPPFVVGEGYALGHLHPVRLGVILLGKGDLLAAGGRGGGEGGCRAGLTSSPSMYGMERAWLR